MTIEHELAFKRKIIYKNDHVILNSHFISDKFIYIERINPQYNTIVTSNIAIFNSRLFYYLKDCIMVFK